MRCARRPVSWGRSENGTIALWDAQENIGAKAHRCFFAGAGLFMMIEAQKK